MPQFLSTSTLPAHLTRAEREYIEHLQTQNKDDSLRHYLIIECWDEHAQDWQPALFYEPTHEVVQAIFSELTPLWTHAQQAVVCECAQHYHRLLAAYRDIETANTSFVMPKSAVDAFCKQPGVKQPAKNMARLLEGKAFFSQQDAANAVYAVLSGVLTDDEIQAFGGALVEKILDTGLDAALREKRLSEIAAALAPYKAVDLHPHTPTLEPCPICHLPRRYSFFELFIGDAQLVSRLMTQLADGHVRPKHVPRMLQALELWLFSSSAADEAYQKKMFPTGSVTGMMLTTLRAALMEIKTEIASRLSSGGASTSTTSTDAGSPPPPLPDAIPPAN